MMPKPAVKHKKVVYFKSNTSNSVRLQRAHYVFFSSGNVHAFFFSLMLCLSLLNSEVHDLSSH